VSKGLLDRKASKVLQVMRESKARKEKLGPQERLDHKENKVVKEKLGPPERLDQ
jgi:hypothetical protein